jgi:hypothetical protein
VKRRKNVEDLNLAKRSLAQVWETIEKPHLGNQTNKIWQIIPHIFNQTRDKQQLDRLRKQGYLKGEFISFYKEGRRN